MGEVASSASGRPARWRTYLRLGRVSNLPTVLTNVVAGVSLGSGRVPALPTAVLMAGSGLAYVGGMFLNDAFDRHVDARQRPERPIPSGDASAVEVFALGSALLVVAVLGIGWLAPAVAGVAREGALGAALALACCIVAYDVWHKSNPLSPLVMGACRSLVVVSSALAVGGSLGRAVLVGAAAVGLYVVGLTFVARREARSGWVGYWPVPLLLSPGALVLAGDRTGPASAALVLYLGWLYLAIGPRPGGGRRAVPVVVGLLIAGISTLDALVVVALGALPREQTAVVIVAVGLLGALSTLAAQRAVSGT